MQNSSYIAKNISNTIHKVGHKVHGIAAKVYTPPTSKGDLRVAKWNADDGEHTLRLNYDLDENSVVFDMGGFEGQWAADIFTRYNCTIHIFEPVKAYAKNIQERFKKNSKVKTYAYGLGSQHETLSFSLEDNASSAFKSNGEIVKVKIIPAIEFMKEHEIGHIDLIKINIEGGEYDLLENLIKNDFLKKITDIQVQFHDFAPDAEKRMEKIQETLSKTHELTYRYPFVWENWRLRSAKP